MAPMVLYGLVFLACVLALGSVYSFLSDLYQRDRGLIRQRLDDEFRGQLREQAKKSPVFKDLAALAAQLPSETGQKPTIRERLQLMLDQAGTKITLVRWFLIAAILGLVLGGGGGVLRKSPLVGSILFVVGITMPFIYVRLKRRPG